MKKTTFGMTGLIAVILGIFLVVEISHYLNKYSNSGSAADIEREIERRSGMEIEIRDLMVTDDKLHFVFTAGQMVGSGEFERGWNRKFKFESFGHGTNGMRQRIVETDKGQYLMLAGRNDEHIGRIRAFVDDEAYDVDIPDAPYYLVMTPVQGTDRKFATGMLVYDREGTELARISVPAGASSPPVR